MKSPITIRTKRLANGYRAIARVACGPRAYYRTIGPVFVHKADAMEYGRKEAAYWEEIGQVIAD